MRKIAAKSPFGGTSLSVNTAFPLVAGAAQVDQTLTATAGTWINGPRSFAYQWSNEGSAIAGATSSTYVLQTSDLGALITVAVTATNGAGASAPALSALAGPVISTTAYYVSSSGGLDTNAGTSPASPWQSLSKVNGFAFPPGASVLFNRGDTFRGQLIPTASGTTGNPIVFDAYGTGPQPIIQGSVSAAQMNQWTNTSGNIWTSNQTFPPTSQSTVTITIASPAVVTWAGAANTNVPVNGQGVVFYTTGALPTGITAGTGYFVVDQSGSTFQIAATHGGTPINTSGSQSGTQSAGGNGLPYNRANDVGNLIWTSSGITNTGTTTYALQVITQTDALLSSNAVQDQWYFSIIDWKVHVYSTTNPAIAMPGLELAINKTGAFFVNSAFVTVQNLALRYAASSGLMAEQTNSFTARDLTISYVGGGNINGAGVRGGNAADIILSGNNIVYERILAYECYDGGLTIQPLASNALVTNVTYRNNVIANTTQGIFQIITRGAALSNISIYNNTGYNAPSWSEGQRWGAGGSSEDGQQYGMYHSGAASPAPANYNNFNNVYAGLGTSCSIRGSGALTDWSGSGNMLLDYNLWSRLNGTAPLYCAVPSPNQNLSAWAAGENPPQEAHGQIGVDPMFVDASAQNFAPAAGSPLLNAGTNLHGAGVVLDFNHNPRPSSGPFTVGAIQ